MVGALLKSGVMLRTLSVSLLSLQHYGLVKVSVLLSVLYSQGENSVHRCMPTAQLSIARTITMPE